MIYWDRQAYANSVDPDQTAPEQSALFAIMPVLCRIKKILIVKHRL